MKRLLVLILVLNLLTLIVLIAEGLFKEDLSGVEEFQRLTSGIGLGASVNPRWGYSIFDPRIERIDETNLFPIPGGYSYVPSKGMCVSDFSEAL